MAANRTSKINQYKREHLKRIALEVPKEKFIEIKNHADNNKESVNGFIKRAIDETIKNDLSNEDSK